MIDMEQPLIFEQNADGRCGVDLPAIPQHQARLGNVRRKGRIGLPGLSEPQVVRHYTRLSQKNYGIDSVFYPLGSCTMKHNPRLNEKLARLPGFGDIHPMQPVSTVQGALELINELSAGSRNSPACPPSRCRPPRARMANSAAWRRSARRSMRAARNATR